MRVISFLLYLLVQVFVFFAALLAWGFARQAYQERDLYRRAGKKASRTLRQAARRR